MQLCKLFANLYAYLSQVKIVDAKTGHIEFNSTGSRCNYSLSLYNHGGIGLFKKVS